MMQQRQRRGIILTEALKVWGEIELDGAVREPDIDSAVKRRLPDFFHVGKYYTYIFDVKNASFRYISPEVTEVLGYSPEEFDIAFYFTILHPEDQELVLNYEQAVVEFFKKLPEEKIPKYKFSYDMRLRKKCGEYIRILQQVATLQFDDSRNELITFGVHTDISHLKKENNSILSFIGLDGEPSYIDVDVAKTIVIKKDLFTHREKDVIRLLLSGQNSAAIATQLNISKFTVDTHRKNILAKANCSNTIELAMKVVSEGLL